MTPFSEYCTAGSFPKERLRFTGFYVKCGIPQVTLFTLNSEGINNADLVLQVRRRSRSVETRINHGVKAKAKGESRVPCCALDAKNLYLSKTDTWEYQYHELDFSSGWAEVEELFLGKEEWEVEAKSAQGVGERKLEGCISKLIFLMIRNQVKKKKITYLSLVSCADGELCQTKPPTNCFL